MLKEETRKHGNKNRNTFRTIETHRQPCHGLMSFMSHSWHITHLTIVNGAHHVLYFVVRSLLLRVGWVLLALLCLGTIAASVFSFCRVFSLFCHPSFKMSFNSPLGWYFVDFVDMEKKLHLLDWIPHIVVRSPFVFRFALDLVIAAIWLRSLCEFN